jgi:hypothetical protein
VLAILGSFRTASGGTYSWYSLVEWLESSSLEARGPIQKLGTSILIAVNMLIHRENTDRNHLGVDSVKRRKVEGIQQVLSITDVMKQQPSLILLRAREELSSLLLKCPWLRSQSWGF